LTKDFQYNLLNAEIGSKINEKTKLMSAYVQIKSLALSRLSFIDVVKFKQILSRITGDFLRVTKDRHSKKLQYLDIETPKSIDPDKVIFNFSNYTLSTREKFLLTLGLNFAVPYNKPNFYKYFLCFEKLFIFLKNEPCYKSSIVIIKEKLKTIAKKFYSDSKKVFHPLFKKDDIRLLRDLHSKNNLVICKPDKGRGVVILNKVDYVNKMQQLLNDSTKFIPCNLSLLKIINKLEDKINRNLRHLKNSDLISDSIYNSVYSSGSTIGVLYGSPKVHKPSVPLRPILAAYNMHNFNLAKFLSTLLKPVSHNHLSVSNSYEFAELIRTQPANSIMVSFDIQSLFTNIPLKETIDIATQRLYDSQHRPSDIDLDTFHLLLNLATTDSYFKFDDNIFQQIDGVAMGSHLGPILADIFLINLQERMFIPSNDFNPFFYRRYVDDVFCLFDSVAQAHLFCDFINRLHPNISFTIEIEQDSKLSFLDVHINRTNTFHTSVFRKPSFTPQGTNFYSFTSLRFKLNAILTLIHRAYKISSNYLSLHLEFSFILTFLNQNGFPSSLVLKHIHSYLYNKYQPRPNTHLVSKKIAYFTFPFIGKRSVYLNKDLSTLINNFFPHIKLNFIFTNSFSISNLFPYKDKFPLQFQSGLVYLFTCACSQQATYVGSTGRTLHSRYCSHAGISSRTFSPLNCKDPSPIRNHIDICGTPMQLKQFKVLAKTSIKSDLLILESLYISNLKPSLNIDTSSTPLFIA